MIKKHSTLVYLALGAFLILTSCGTGRDHSSLLLDSSLHAFAQKGTAVRPPESTSAVDWTVTPEVLQYHNIVVDDLGNILPWYNPDSLGDSYDQVMRLGFDWWLSIPRDPGEADLAFYAVRRIWRGV